MSLPSNTERDRWVALCDAAAGALPGDWLEPLRRKAARQFAALGFPTTRDEAWRYTSVAPILRGGFNPAGRGTTTIDKLAIDALGIAALADRRLVFVNGHYRSELSAKPSTSGGVIVTSLGELMTAPPSWLEKHLGQMADHDAHPFAALNLALAGDGACVYLPRSVVIERPIELLFVEHADGDAPPASHARNLIVAEASSEVHIIEHHRSLGAGPSLANYVTEVVVQANARVEHTRIQDLSQDAYLIGDLSARLERDGRLMSRSFSFGGRLVRQDIAVEQAATGIECTLDGLFVGNGQQHIDHHTVVDHARPHGTSHELYKGILDGHAVGVFDGKVLVRKDAQKTDAKQSNKNLLLSRDAVIETKPQLEILADDVKCAHGATIGQLDPTQLFYLQSRGIPAATARRMLLQAFAQEVVLRIGDPSVRDFVGALLQVRLPDAATESGSDAATETRA